MIVFIRAHLSDALRSCCRNPERFKLLFLDCSRIIVNWHREPGNASERRAAIHIYKSFEKKKFQRGERASEWAKTGWHFHATLACKSQEWNVQRARRRGVTKRGTNNGALHTPIALLLYWTVFLFIGRNKLAALLPAPPAAHWQRCRTVWSTMPLRDTNKTKGGAAVWQDANIRQKK